MGADAAALAANGAATASDGSDARKDPSLAVVPRRLPGKLPLAMALALTGGTGAAECFGAGPGPRLLLLAPGLELVVLNVRDPEVRLHPRDIS